MIHHPAFYDPADKVMLTHSMMLIAQEWELLSPSEIGYIDEAAQLAATYLPGMLDEAAGWDGVRWFERLENTEPGSLARNLLSVVAANQPDRPDPEPMKAVVYRCVLEWVKSRTLPLSYWAKVGIEP